MTQGDLGKLTRGTTAEYAYDAEGRQISERTPDDTLYFIPAPGRQVLGVHGQSGDWQHDLIYIHGRPLATITAGETTEVFSYLTDHLGTPIALTDEQKTVRWSAKYYPYGELSAEYVSIGNELRFPGQWHDRESGLYYNWHRYYDPSTGRYVRAKLIAIFGRPLRNQ